MPGHVPLQRATQTVATQQQQPAGGKGNGLGSPLDSTYFSNVAANLFKANQAINGLNLSTRLAGTSLQNTLGQIAYAQPRAQLAAEQKFNANGGLFSSVENQAEGDLANKFLQARSAAENKFTSLRDMNALKIGQLRAGIPIYNNEQALAAGQRATKLAASSPAPAPIQAARKVGGRNLTHASRSGSRAAHTVGQRLAREGAHNTSQKHVAGALARKIAAPGAKGRATRPHGKMRAL
jgi:hypothetical protein